MQKTWKECGTCGGDSFRIKNADNSVVCADCGSGRGLGWYSSSEVPPSDIVNKANLMAAYMDVFKGRRPTDAEIRMIEIEVGDDFSRIDNEIHAAVESLKEKGKLPHESNG